MKTSLRAKQFIKDHEGLRLNVYRDAVGIMTIGWGHTSDEKYPVTTKMKITKSMAETLLVHDIREAEAGINNLVSVPMNGNQYGALVSFVFNVGIDGFRGSSLRRAINKNAGSAAITRAFNLWVKGGKPKRTIKGLVKRRAEEAALFFTPSELGSKAIILPNTGEPTLQIEEARETKHDVSAGGDGTFAVQTGTGITGTGAVTDIVREQTDQLSFIAEYSTIIQYAVMALVLLGVGITIYGLWLKFRER